MKNLTELSCVVIDTREKNMEIYEFLDRNKVNVAQDALDVGDIMVFGRETFLIERKTEADFISSLLDGRLFTQMRNLAETSDVNKYVPCLLFIGDKWKIWKFRNIKPIQVAGALNTIQFKFGIQIIEERTEASAGLRILNLVQMFDPEKKITNKVYPIRTISKKNLTKEEYARSILEGFPAISAVRSKKIIEHYGDLTLALEGMKTGDIENIGGIGKKIAEAVKVVF